MYLQRVYLYFLFLLYLLFYRLRESTSNAKREKLRKLTSNVQLIIIITKNPITESSYG